MFLLYMVFCDFIASDPLNPQIFTILAFLEFLAFNNLKPPSILNYMSAIRSQFTWFNLDTQTLFHPKIKHMLRALELSNHTAPIQKAIFDVPTLMKIIETCLLFPLPLTFRALFLLAFFGFLRIFNLVPPSKASFDVTKHLCRGDIIFQDSHAIVLIKWSKTLQSSTKGTFIIIPSLGNSPPLSSHSPESLVKNLSTFSKLPLISIAIRVPHPIPGSNPSGKNSHPPSSKSGIIQFSYLSSIRSHPGIQS